MAVESFNSTQKMVFLTYNQFYYLKLYECGKGVYCDNGKGNGIEIIEIETD